MLTRIQKHKLKSLAVPVVQPVRSSGAGLTLTVAVIALAVGTLGAPPQLLAQGFQWPWATETKPRPRPAPRGPSGFDDPRGWAPVGDICLQLERRLVQEGQSTNRSRDQIPALSAEIRDVRRAMNDAQGRLERKNCYSYFLFSKTLKRTRRCIKLANERQANKRRLAQLETQLGQINSSSGRSYQDDIIRELARNNCGANYQQQARRNNNPFSPFWQDEENSGYDGAFGRYNSALPYATYRTMCVRLCDGYYFPISFSTLPNHFGRDAERCQAKCAAPSQLFYYQNPGGAVEQMVSTQGNQLYTDLKTAFRYRKEYIRGCSCKLAEYTPEGAPSGVQRSQTGGEPQQRAEGSAIAEGWAAQTQPR